MLEENHGLQLVAQLVDYLMEAEEILEEATSEEDCLVEMLAAGVQVVVEMEEEMGAEMVEDVEAVGVVVDKKMEYHDITGTTSMLRFLYNLQERLDFCRINQFLLIIV